MAEEESKVSNFSAKQELAISLFGQGKKWAEVSEIVGVSMPTLARWRNDVAGFKERIRVAQIQNNSLILANLEDAMSTAENKAIIFLTSLLDDTDVRMGDRINAAKALLSHQNSRKAHEDNSITVAFEDAPLPGVPLEQNNE